MDSNKRTRHVLIVAAVVIGQLFMTQVVTLLASFFFPEMGASTETVPKTYIAIMGLSFTLGIFLFGWLAIRLHWLAIKPRYLARVIGTLVGAYLPLVAAILFLPAIQVGSPVFFISMLTGILGFYIPGWIK